MKQTILFVLFCLLSFSLLAQGNQGKMTLSGGVSFESHNEKFEPAAGEHDRTALTIMPEFGYYISDAVKLGLGIGYSTTKNENTPVAPGVANSTETNMLVINPFVRFYTAASEKVDLFLQAGVEFGMGGYESSPGTSAGDVSMLGIWLSPGVEFMMSQRISLDASVGMIGYHSTTVTPDGTPTVKTIESGFDFIFDLSSVHFGINIFLN